MLFKVESLCLCMGVRGGEEGKDEEYWKVEVEEGATLACTEEYGMGVTTGVGNAAFGRMLEECEMLHTFEFDDKLVL